MIALVLELYGAFCLFSLIAFLVWASVAKLRPDLDEPEFDLDELEKLKNLASCEPLPVKRKSRRLFQRHQPLFQTRTHRPT